MLSSYAYIVSTLTARSIGTSFVHMLCFGINIAQGNYLFFFPYTKQKEEEDRFSYIHIHLPNAQRIHLGKTQAQIF